MPPAVAHHLNGLPRQPPASQVLRSGETDRPTRPHPPCRHRLRADLAIIDGFDRSRRVGGELEPLDRGDVPDALMRAHVVVAKRAKRPRGRVLGEPGPLRDRVTAELRAHRSPAAIAADLRADGGEGVCAETIYASVYDRTLEVKPSECLRRKRARRRRRQERHANKRPALPNISLRPAAVNDRAEVGHFEMDLIIGAHNRSALLTAQERLTRYLWLVTLPEGYLAESVLAAQSELFSQVSAHLLGSVTFDQGSEWAEWETLAATFGLKAWFCDPHSPWQRGAIENTNGHLRHWFPRGTELAGLDPAETDGVAHLLNGQRRRSLGWESAEQRWIAAGGVPLCSPSVTRSNGLIIAA